MGRRTYKDVDTGSHLSLDAPGICNGICHRNERLGGKRRYMESKVMRYVCKLHEDVWKTGWEMGDELTRQCRITSTNVMFGPRFVHDILVV